MHFWIKSCPSCGVSTGNNLSPVDDWKGGNIGFWWSPSGGKQQKLVHLTFLSVLLFVCLTWGFWYLPLLKREYKHSMKWRETCRRNSLSYGQIGYRKKCCWALGKIVPNLKWARFLGPQLKIDWGPQGTKACLSLPLLLLGGLVFDESSASNASSSVRSYHTRKFPVPTGKANKLLRSTVAGPVSFCVLFIFYSQLRL